MSFLENPKQYTGNDLETIFFRPMLSGTSAQELGVRVLYNMPVPTTIQLWDGQRNVLQKYTTAGWTGGAAAQKTQKIVDLKRVKAELGFSAADYFSMIYEQIASLSGVNMDDLSGTELEQAETTLFKQAIAEGIRATMWAGNSASASGLNTFDGFLKTINAAVAAESINSITYPASELDDHQNVVALFDKMWKTSEARLQDLKADGQLAYFVSSDIYTLYEKYLDSKGVDAAYTEAINGRQGLFYHGIPVIDIRMGSYLSATTLHKSFCLLTDRRNLVLAVNTADFPGNEVRMWYNPDLMENRQRAIFMAGCEILDEGLLTYAYKE